jgi:hypothetical protein
MTQEEQTTYRDRTYVVPIAGGWLAASPGIDLEVTAPTKEAVKDALGAAMARRLALGGGIKGGGGNGQKLLHERTAFSVRLTAGEQLVLAELTSKTKLSKGELIGNALLYLAAGLQDEEA